MILNLKKEIEFLRVHLKKNNISIPTLNNDQEETTVGDPGQNYYAQYKELETKYKYLEVFGFLLKKMKFYEKKKKGKNTD